MNNQQRRDFDLWEIEQSEDYSDELAPARGVLAGLVLGSVLWAALFWALALLGSVLFGGNY